jgi:hypothetical protein
MFNDIRLISRTGNMEITVYDDSYKELWDDFVADSNNGTMFHLQQFLSYHKPGKFTFKHLMFTEQGRIVAVLPGALTDGIYESPIGASFGSIVTGDLNFTTAMTIVETLLDYSRKERFRQLMLTGAPIIYEEYPNQNLDFAMRWQGMQYELHYISSAIALDTGRDIISRFQATVRNYVRKSLRTPEITVMVNDDYEKFYPIIEANLNKHGVKPTHSLEELLRLKDLLPDRIKLFLVCLAGKPVGGSVMFFPNERVALCFYNMFLYEYARFRPIHRVMYEVVKYCTDAGYKYVDIGVSQDTSAENPMTPNTSLIAFKETFDAKTVMRNTFSIRL